MISVRKKGERHGGTNEPDKKIYDFRLLSLYIIQSGTDDKKALHCWAAGYNSENVELAIYEAEATQMLNYRSKDKTYHLMVSFRPEDEAKLTPAVLRDIEENFAKALGFENHQRICGVHVDTDNMHMHIAYNKIEPKKLTSLMPFQDYPKRDRVCRAMEQKYGLKIDLGKSDKEREYHSDKALTMEKMSGLESLETYVKNHREAILQKLATAADWHEAHAVFTLYGLAIKPSGSGFAISDKHSNHRVKASNIDRSLSKKRMETKFGEYLPPAPDQEFIEEERYKARPMQPKSAARDKLFEIYSEMIDCKYTRLKEINQQAKAEIVAIEAEYDKYCSDLIFTSMLAKDRRKLIKQFRLEEKQEISKIRAAAAAEKDAVNKKTPFRNWNEYLQQEAKAGNATALVILRSRMLPSDKTAKIENDRLVLEAKNSILEEIRKEQFHILANENLFERDRSKFLQKLKLQEYAVYNNEIAELLDLPFEVDSKGTVIFTLPNGGKIRDDGLKIHFSAHDPEAVKKQILVENMASRRKRQIDLRKSKITDASGLGKGESI